MTVVPDRGQAGEQDDTSFVGRARERRVLEGTVRAGGRRGAAAVLLGEPGIGKTALLSEVARATGADVAWIRGAEAESRLPFAAAADLLLPLRRQFGRLPPAQRRALEVVLALADGPAPAPLAACAGALSALSAAARENPLVVFVDNLQWIDAESRRLLLFVARRLASEHVVMLFAARDDVWTRQATVSLPALRLSGLSVPECQELTRRRGLSTPAQVVAAVAATTSGNPRALLDTLAEPADHGRPAGVSAAGPLDVLTTQELQVARVVATGRNNTEAAATLFMSRKTVEAHLTRVYRKLSIRSRTELARVLLANGIAD
jgi:DNA-binding NarL/FixJ family response regulator